MSFPWNIRPFIKSYERLWSARRTRRIPQHGAWKMHELNSVKRGTKTSINQPWSITQGKQQAGIHPWKTYVKSENTIRKEKYQAKTHPILFGFGACDREFLTGGALPMGFLGILRENRCRARLLHLQYARVARWLVVVVDGGERMGPQLLLDLCCWPWWGTPNLWENNTDTHWKHTFFVVYRCMSLQWEGQFLPEFCWIAWLLLFLWVQFKSDSDADNVVPSSLTPGSKLDGTVPEGRSVREYVCMNMYDMYVFKGLPPGSLT